MGGWGAVSATSNAIRHVIVDRFYNDNAILRSRRADSLRSHVIINITTV